MAVVKSIDVALRAVTTEFEAGFKSSAKTADAFASNFTRVESEMKKANQLFSAGAIDADEFSSKIAACDKELAALSSGFAGMAGATQRAQAILLGMETETDRYNRKLKELDSLLKLGTFTQEQHAAAVKHTEAAYKASIPTAELAGQKTSELGAMFTSFTGKLVVAATAMKGIQVASRMVHAGLEGVSRQMEEVDSAKKAAATIGIATGELLKLRFAVDEVAGVSVDDALKKMIKNIAEAAITGKGATDTINRIGLSVSSLAAMSPERAFLTITDAISKLEGTGERGAAVVKLFGKEGMSLGPIFEGGAEALKKSAEFAEKFNLGASEMDSSAIEQANDSLKRMSKMLDSLYRQIAFELAPQIIAFGRTVEEQSGNVNSSIGEIRTAFTYAGYAASVLVGSIRNIVTELALIVLPKPIADAVGLFVRAKNVVDETSAAMSESGTFSKQYADNLKKVTAELEAQAAASKKQFTVGGAFDPESESAQKSAAADEKAQLAKNAKAIAAADHRAKAIRDLERAVSGNTPAVKFKHQVEDIDEALKKQLITLEKRNALVMEAHQTIIVEPAQKKEAEERKKRIDESVKLRIDSNPLEKFAVESARIRKLELAGEMDQKAAALATADARKEAVAELVKMQKDGMKLPTFKMPDLAFKSPTIPAPTLPKFQMPSLQAPPQLAMPSMPTPNTSIYTAGVDSQKAYLKKIDEINAAHADHNLTLDRRNQLLLQADALLKPTVVLTGKQAEAMQTALVAQKAQAAAIQLGIASQKSYLKEVESINAAHADHSISLAKRNELLRRLEPPKTFAPNAMPSANRMAGIDTRTPTPTSPAAEAASIKMEAMKVRGAEITKKLEHPFTAFQRTVDELSGLRKVGAISQTTLATGIMEAKQTAIDELSKRPELQPPQQVKGPAAIEAGTNAAFSAFQENRRNDNNSKSQVELQKAMVRHLEKLARGGMVLKPANL